MRILILVLDIVRIASHHERQIKLFRKLHQSLINMVLNIPMRRRFRMAMVLHLQIETPFESLRVPLHQFTRLVHVTIANRHRNLRASTARKTNHALVILFHHAMVDTWLIVLTFSFGNRQHATKVFKTLVCLSNQSNMEAFLIIGWVAVFQTARRHIGLEAKNRFYTRVIRGFIEVNEARHCAVVGHRHRFHARLFHEVDQLIHLRQTIQKRIVRVIVQVHKITRF